MHAPLGPRGCRGCAPCTLAACRSADQVQGWRQSSSICKAGTKVFIAWEILSDIPRHTSDLCCQRDRLIEDHDDHQRSRTHVVMDVYHAPFEPHLDPKLALAKAASYHLSLTKQLLHSSPGIAPTSLFNPQNPLRRGAPFRSHVDANTTREDDQGVSTRLCPSPIGNERLDPTA